MTVSYAAASALVDAQYNITKAALASDPEYQNLVAAAEAEARSTPFVYLARNRLTLHIEVNTPLFPRIDPARFVKVAIA